MAARADLDAVTQEVKALLETVPNCGKVENRSGGTPTWLQSNFKNELFSEIEIIAANESYSAASEGTEYIHLAVDMFMQFRFQEPNDSAGIFRGLITAFKNKLSTNETLDGEACRAELPNAETIDYVVFPDEQKQNKCHHCRITIVYLRDFDVDQD